MNASNNDYWVPHLAPETEAFHKPGSLLYISRLEITDKYRNGINSSCFLGTRVFSTH